MMFAGLISRCSTPRLCAYSIALQTSINLRSNFAEPSDRRPASVFSALVGVEALDGLL